MSKPPRAHSTDVDAGPARKSAARQGLRTVAGRNASGRGSKLSLAAIVAAATPPEATPARPAARPRTAEIVPLGVLPAQRPAATLKQRARQMSVYLEPPVYDQLRDLAYAERAKMHALMLEALDLLFKQRGARSITQLSNEGSR